MGNIQKIYLDVIDSESFFKQEKKQNLEIKPSFNLLRENGDIIDGSDLSYLGRGENSTVWKYESGKERYAVKIFFDIAISCALTKDTYRSMVNLPLKNTLKALEVLDVVGNSTTIRSGYYAYMMKYLDEKKGYSIVNMSTSKLLENSSSMEQDAELLANNHVAMFDLKRENTIFNQDDSYLYLSDVDMFCRSWESFRDVSENNFNELNFIFYHFLSDYSKEYFHDRYHNLLKDIFLRNTLHKKSPTEKLEYLFSSYDTPKQFFKDHEKSYTKK